MIMVTTKQVIEDHMKAYGPRTYGQLLAEVLDQATFEEVASGDPVEAASKALSAELKDQNNFTYEAQDCNDTVSIFWDLNYGLYL